MEDWDYFCASQGEIDGSKNKTTDANRDQRKKFWVL